MSDGTASPVVKAYQWYADGEAIEGADEETLLVTADMIGSEISVSAKATTGDWVFSDETAPVAALEGVEIISAEQSGTNTIRVEFSEAISVDDTIEVFKGTAKVEIADIDYDGDFEGATLTMKDKITAATYTVVLTPDEIGVDPSELSFDGEVSALGTIEFLNNYLVMKDNDYNEGYCFVKGYDQFGTEINLAGLTVTAGAGEMKSYDSKTGKITLVDDSAQGNAYMFMKQVPVFVSYQTGEGIISAQANLEVTSRSFVENIEFGEIKKDGTPRADGRLTITELASKKYYVELDEITDQYGNPLSYKDLNDQKADNVLFVIPSETSGAYYKTGDFDTIGDQTILWIYPTDDPKPGTMDLSITGAGGQTASIPVTIEDDPYIATMTTTWPQIYEGHSKSADLAFDGVDQYGEPVDFWAFRPTVSLDGTTLTFGDKNNMTGKSTEIKLSGGALFNAVIEDTTSKTWTVNIDAGAAQAKSMVVATTLTAGMTPYTKTITVGQQGQAVTILKKLSGGDTELKPRNTEFNFNQNLQFEDINGEVMNRVSSEQYPAFVNTITVSATDSAIQMKDYDKFAWTLSEAPITVPATATLTYGTTATPNTVALDDNGVVTRNELVAGGRNNAKYYVTAFGYDNEKAKWQKLDEQDFRLTYIPAADAEDGLIDDAEFDPTDNRNKYTATISGPIYVDPDNGTSKKVDVTVTNSVNETFKLTEGRGYRVSVDSGLTASGCEVSGKVSGPTSGTANVDVWLTGTDKKIATITVDYTNAAPVPTSVEYKAKITTEGHNNASKVGKKFDYTPASKRIETSATAATKITAKDGVLTIEKANDLGDTYTAAIKDQYGNVLKDTVFYMNGVAATTSINAGFVDEGAEYTFKLVNGNVNAEYVVVPADLAANTHTISVTEPLTSADMTASTPASLAAAIKKAANESTVKNTITVTEDVALAAAVGENLSKEDKIVVAAGKKLTLAGHTVIKGALVLEDGAELVSLDTNEGEITIKSGAKATLIKDNKGKIVVKDGGELTKLNNNGTAAGTLDPHAVVEVDAFAAKALVDDNKADGEVIYKGTDAGVTTVTANTGIVYGPATCAVGIHNAVNNGALSTVSVGTVNVTPNGFTTTDGNAELNAAAKAAGYTTNVADAPNGAKMQYLTVGPGTFDLHFDVYTNLAAYNNGAATIYSEDDHAVVANGIIYWTYNFNNSWTTGQAGLAANNYVVVTVAKDGGSTATYTLTAQ